MSELVRKVQRIFGDTSEAQIYVQDIIDWANEAQMEIARQTECLTAIQSVDTTVDAPTDGIDLPTDFISEKRVTYSDLPLTRMNFDDITGSPAQTGEPAYFYFMAGKIFLYPVPTNLGNLYKLYYNRAPALLGASGDGLELPQHLQEDVTRYCLLRAKELNEDEQSVDRLTGEWQARMSESRDEAQHPSDSYPVVRDYEGDRW